jgi:hypothetical protein
MYCPCAAPISSRDSSGLAVSTERASDLGSPRRSIPRCRDHPRCAECEAHWLPADEERWQAWLTDDEPPELASYCPECAEREFGGG